MKNLKRLSGLLLIGGLILLIGASYAFAAKQVKLTYLRFGGRNDVIQTETLIKKFQEKHPNVEIELLMMPFQQFKQKLDTMIAGGQSPDIVFGWPVPFANLWYNKRIISLNPLIEKDPTIDMKDYPLAFQFVFDGQYTGLPYNNTAHMMIFNKDMFKKAGLENPLEMYYKGGKNTWNWDTAIAAGKKLTKDIDGDGVSDEYGMAPLGRLQIFTILWSYGESVFDKDHKKMALDTPGAREAIQLIVDVHRKHKIAPPPEMQASEIGISFDTGKVAMGWQSAATCMLRQLRHKEPWDWDIIVYPAGKKGYAAWADGNSLAISVTAEDKDMAWEFLKAKTSVESWKTRFELGLPFRLPPSIEVINSPEFRELWDFVDVDMILKTFTGEIAETPLVPRSPEAYRIIYDVVTVEVDNAVRGVKSVDQAVKDIVRRGEDIFAGF